MARVCFYNSSSCSRGINGLGSVQSAVVLNGISPTTSHCLADFLFGMLKCSRKGFGCHVFTVMNNFKHVLDFIEEFLAISLCLRVF